jgi:hypothetical protein
VGQRSRARRPRSNRQALSGRSPRCPERRIKGVSNSPGRRSCGGSFAVATSSPSPLMRLTRWERCCRGPKPLTWSTHPWYSPRVAAAALSPSSWSRVPRAPGRPPSSPSCKVAGLTLCDLRRRLAPRRRRSAQRSEDRHRDPLGGTLSGLVVRSSRGRTVGLTHSPARPCSARPPDR